MIINYLNSSQRESIRSNQNEKLGDNTMRAYYLLDQAKVNNEITNKLSTIGQATGRYNGIPVATFYGPSMVTGILPEDGSSASDTVITLQWSETDGAVSYNIYISKNVDELRSATIGSASFAGNTTDTTWQLTNIETRREYFWAVDAVGNNGIRKGEINSVIYGVASSVNDNNNNKMALKYELRQNYPNPFNPETVISFSLAKPGNVDIAIMDVMGRKIKSLLNENKAAGNFNVTWDGLNDADNEVATGIYFARFSTNGQSKMIKMLLVR